MGKKIPHRYCVQRNNEVGLTARQKLSIIDCGQCFSCTHVKTCFVQNCEDCHTIVKAGVAKNHRFHQNEISFWWVLWRPLRDHLMLWKTDAKISGAINTNAGKRISNVHAQPSGCSPCSEVAKSRFMVISDAISAGVCGTVLLLGSKTVDYWLKTVNTATTECYHSKW